MKTPAYSYLRLAHFMNFRIWYKIKYSRPWKNVNLCKANLKQGRIVHRSGLKNEEKIYKTKFKNLYFNLKDFIFNKHICKMYILVEIK